MYRLTKRQRKDRERVLAWLNGEEFQENSRAKPGIPDLELEEVLAAYVPPDVDGAGQFFTPLEAAQEVYQLLDLPAGGFSLLEPCAGIGHLLYPLRQQVLGRPGVRIVCYELEEECVRIGRTLFPEAEWRWQIPFDCLDEIEGQFDFVLMNPPFNTRRGMAPGERMVEGRSAKSLYIFFELAMRALKPGGQAVIVAPWNLHTRMPRGMREKWLSGYAFLEYDGGATPLPGEFKVSKSMRTHAFAYRRDALSDIYARTQERQHAPGGVMTKIEVEWAELNPPKGDETLDNDKMKAAKCKAGTLRPHPAWSRSSVPVGHVAELVLQIDSYGLDESRPIVVTAADAEGKRMIISGHCRVLSLCLLREVHEEDDLSMIVDKLTQDWGEDLASCFEDIVAAHAEVEIPVLVPDFDYRQQVEALLSHSYGALAPDAVGEGQAFRSAMETGMSKQEIARLVGKSQDYVQRRLDLLRLGEGVREKIARGEFPLGYVKPLVDLPDERRRALEAVLLRQGWSLPVARLEQICAALARLAPEQARLVAAETPREYFRSRLETWLVNRALDVDRAGAWERFAMAAVNFSSPQKVLCELLPEFQDPKSQYGPALDESKIAKQALPNLSCENCPLRDGLPEEILNVDLERDLYPCRRRKKDRFPEGGCFFAPGVEGSPWVVEVPWAWSGLPGVEQRRVTSLENLQKAWEARKAVEQDMAAALEADEGSAPAPSGEMTPSQRMIAQVRQFQELSAELSHAVPWGTSCENCRHHKKPRADKPPCEWTRRVRNVEFLVRRPVSGVGPVFGVCRQFAWAEGFTWETVIPSHPDPPKLSREIMASMILCHERQFRYLGFGYPGPSYGHRTFLETLTGRPFRRDDDHSEWFVQQFADAFDRLSDGQLWTLVLWSFTEWFDRRGKQYPLYVDDQVIDYETVSFETWVAQRNGQRAEEGNDNDAEEE